MASFTQDSTGAEQAETKRNILEDHGYQLGHTIGSGSYATVKVAVSERHHCNVAIKIVSKASAPEDYMHKFLPREIEVVKGLRHPNLIRFLQAIETTHRVYIVMEYAENGSLLDIIRKDTHIDEVRARKWFTQLVDAVEYCHSRGVVHRDIKCENLLMDRNWNIKLSDFGFARTNIRTRDGTPVLSETFCGSYAYASPEILRGQPYMPQYADVWSMGVVLFAMVYGKLPFDDSDFKELLKQVSSKVVFPKDPKVSYICRSLIGKILSPLQYRLRITGIRDDTWFTNSTQQGTSARPGPEEKERKLSIPSKDIIPPKMVTKKQLESGAKPRDKRRRSTLEESAIEIREPDSETSEDSEENSIPEKEKKGKDIKRK